MKFANRFGLSDGDGAEPCQSKCGSTKNILPFLVVSKLGNKKTDAEDAEKKPHSCVFAHFSGPAVQVSTGAPCGGEADKTCKQNAENFIAIIS